MRDRSRRTRTGVASLASARREVLGRRAISLLGVGVHPTLDFGDVRHRRGPHYDRVSRDTLYKLTAARAIPFRKKLNGQGLRFHRDELDGWMETHYPRLDRLG